MPAPDLSYSFKDAFGAEEDPDGPLKFFWVAVGPEVKSSVYSTGSAFTEVACEPKTWYSTVGNCLKAAEEFKGRLRFVPSRFLIRIKPTDGDSGFPRDEHPQMLIEGGKEPTAYEIENGDFLVYRSWFALVDDQAIKYAWKHPQGFYTLKGCLKHGKNYYKFQREGVGQLEELAQVIKSE